MDRGKQIRAYRKIINDYLGVLNSDIVIANDDNGSAIKTAVKTRHNAFVRASNVLMKLQKVESASAKGVNEKWYQTTILSLIDSGDKAMNELNKVSRTKINSYIPPASLNSLIDVKEEANNYSDDIFDRINELQNILKAIDRGDGIQLLDKKVFKSSFAEDFAYDGTRFFNDKGHKHKAGYDEKTDAVLISYDGSVGETINCYGLRITLPKTPLKKSAVNYKKKKELQFWERPTLPKTLTPENAHVHQDIIKEEYRRRDEGYWFLNNGKMEYITGAYYMLLTHLKTDADGGFFHFRKAHRDLFYFLEASWVDKRSLGTILGKTRRTGATYVAMAFTLTKGISLRSANLGMTSKVDKDAQKMFARLSFMFKHMPFFFKPINTGEGLTKELAFETPSNRTSKNNQKKDTSYDDLGTVIDFQATGEDSYDSQTIKFYTLDELSKWKSGNILNHWSKARKTLMKGSRIHGKAFALSTVEYVTGMDHTDPSAKSGDRFKHLFYSSLIDERIEETGMTHSGLYKIFISSLDNYEGFIDRYGNCIKETPEKPIVGVDGEMITMGVRDYLNASWSVYKNNASKLNDEKRKDPITEEDMFRIASDDSLFNVLKVQDQLEYNNNKYIETGEKGYKIGNFRYKSSVSSDVEFVEMPNGRFKISWFPDESMCNQADIKNGKKSPAFDYVGVFGVDPYKLNRTVGGKGSKGGIVGYLMNHPIDGVPKDEFFLLYLARPQSLDVFFEDVMMCCLYYGMPALIENNIPEILRVMHGRDYSNYSMRRPDKDLHRLTVDELMYGGIPSTDTALIRTQAMFLEKYIEDNIGYADTDTYRGIGEIGHCPFDEMLADWLTFDITNRTVHDATVAACLAIYGAQKFNLRNKKNDKKKIKASDFYNFTRNKTA